MTLYQDGREIAIPLLHCRAIMLCMKEERELVTIEEVERRWGIPRQIIYRRMKAGLVPYVDVSKPYHKRRQYRFVVAEVAEALGVNN